MAFVVKGSMVWVSLDPARGAEVPKTRPCIVVSRTEANDISSTITIVPLSSVKGRAAGPSGAALTIRQGNAST